MNESKFLEYNEGDTLLEGYLAVSDSTLQKKPAVLVVHDWSGRNEFACQKANLLAELGYTGFAVDMYGKGKIGKTKEEKVALMQPLAQNRSLLLKRIMAAYNTVKQLPGVDSQKIAAIGFCFGGLCVLDLARSGTDVAGVVSFHGLLGAPDKHDTSKIAAKILVLHGYDDPMVTHENVISFCNEMTAVKADWQMQMYGNTMHAFTNPEANDPDFGTVYNKTSATRAWQSMESFFKEIL
jgi:dienelactone hydrolase